MADYVIMERSNLVAVADAVRNKTETTEEMTLGEIADNIEDIGGVNTSDATATAYDMLNGATAYVDGEKITGTIPVITAKEVVPSSEEQIAVHAGSYTNGDIAVVGDSNLAPENIAEGVSIFGVAGTHSSGIDTSDADATSFDILSGKTAYVDGEKITGKISRELAKTVMPSATSQTAIMAGRYADGNITVAGDSNLVPQNIADGVSIFGVTGTYVGTNLGDDGEAVALITKTLTNFNNDTLSTVGACAFYRCVQLQNVGLPACTTIGSSAFYYCTNLKSINLSACTSIGNNAFMYCANLSNINFPLCTTIGSGAFSLCSMSLTTASFPVCTYIGSWAFDRCTRLTTANFPVCTYIGNSAFNSCANLSDINFPLCTTIGACAFYECRKFPLSARFPACISISHSAFRYCVNFRDIYLMASSVCSLASSNAFAGTSITSSKGYIYVPTSLVDAYKSAANWSYFKNRIYGYDGE